MAICSSATSQRALKKKTIDGESRKAKVGVCAKKKAVCVCAMRTELSTSGQGIVHQKIYKVF